MTDTFPPAVVERVARAICAAEGEDPDATDLTGVPAMWGGYIYTAFAALRALSPAAQAVIMGEAVAVPREVLERIECTMLHGDYRNGVTDSTGSIDEGDVRAGNVIDEVRRLLAASPCAEKGSCSVCGGDCSAANPPVTNCPMQEPTP